MDDNREEYDILYLAYSRLRELVGVGMKPKAAVTQAAKELAIGDPEMLQVLREALSLMADALEEEESYDRP